MELLTFSNSMKTLTIWKNNTVFLRKIENYDVKNDMNA